MTPRPNPHKIDRKQVNMALLACVSMDWVGLGLVYDPRWFGPCFAFFSTEQNRVHPVEGLGPWAVGRSNILTDWLVYACCWLVGIL